MKTNTRYTLVSRSGNEIFSANSFIGFICMMYINALLTAIAFAILGGIICGIASLFN